MAPRFTQGPRTERPSGFGPLGNPVQLPLSGPDSDGGHWCCPTSCCLEKYILGKSNEVLMVGVDVGLLNVNQKKNLGGKLWGVAVNSEPSQRGAAARAIPIPTSRGSWNHTISRQGTHPLPIAWGPLAWKRGPGCFQTPRPHTRERMGQQSNVVVIRAASEAWSEAIRPHGKGLNKSQYAVTYRVPIGKISQRREW